MPDDDFELWLGRIGKDPSFRGAVRRVANLAGGVHGHRTKRLTGARIGRGSAVGALLGSTNGMTGRRSRRVIVKARFVRLAGKGLQAAAVHLRYLQRDGTTRESDRGTLYNAGGEGVDGRAFHERGAGDRHQFRFIVSAEDGAEYADLKPLVRRWIAQVERDLGTRLDWIAIDHFDTGQPHSHVIVRGKDERGQDLVIARNYLSHGLRERAAEIVNLDLGPRSDREIAAADRREVTQERMTGIDRRLLRAVGPEGTVSPVHRDRREQALRAGRIGTLVRMGLARKLAAGRWRLDDRLEGTLRGMERRGDIIATLNQAARAQQLDVNPAGFAVYEPENARSGPVIGRVVERGLAEQHDDRVFLIIDGVDGRAHYVDCGARSDALDDVARGMTVRVTPAMAEPREVDRTVADIAEAHGGYYSAELHALHDPGASERYITAHVRRLEALRRSGSVATRDPDGLWRISADHLERAREYERRRSDRQPALVTVLVDRPIEQLVQYDGITVLDEDPVLATGNGLGGGFGRKVADALARRRQWLTERGLDGADGTETLRRREFQRVAMMLARTFDRIHIEVADGDRVRGAYRQAIQVGAVRMAVIEDGSGFSLVPWRSTLERQRGREVSGIMRGRDVNWSFGRQRSGLER